MKVFTLTVILVTIVISAGTPAEKAAIAVHSNHVFTHEESGDEFKVGIYGIGLDAYWDQFDGLHDRLQGYQKTIAQRMSAENPGLAIVNTGIVDNPQKARRVGKLLAQQGPEIIFLYVSTYALSSTVLPVAQRVKVPIVVLNLQPSNAIDYKTFNALGDRGVMTGQWLAYCQACAETTMKISPHP